MAIEIKHRWTGAVIYRSETATTVREAVIELATKAIANLSRANLSGADLSGADLSDANLSDANLSRADLSGANLSRADLSGAYLSGAYLSGADLSGANLSRADLSGANLSRANLSRADLSDADLSDANLSRADLSGANLSGANLSRADLSRADLSEIRDDVWKVLDAAPHEVTGLLFAVREGRINGSVYSGECACLVGTIAALRTCSVHDLPREIRPDAFRLAERWFLGIKPGDAPEHHPVSRITAQWIEEWMVAHEVAVPRAMTFAQAAAFARANPDAFEAFVSAGQ
jgi:hypothetical protein